MSTSAAPVGQSDATTPAGPGDGGGGSGAGGGGGAAPEGAGGGSPTPASGDSGAGTGDAGGGTVLGGEQSDPAGDKGRPEQSTSGDALKITLPEGAQVNKAVLAEFTEMAKKAGMTSDSASEMVAWQFSKLQASAAEQQGVIDQQEADWGKELKSDKEFGGDNYEATVNNAKKALRKFGGDDLAKSLGELGVGNHPGLVKAFAQIGAALGEDSSDAGGGASGGAPSQQQRNIARYPEMAKQLKGVR